MITNIDIDEAVVAEAMRLSGARTKREVVDRALREMVARATRPSVRELFGIGGVDPEYDPKAPWARGAEVGQYRVEQPRATYQSPARPAAEKTARPARSKKTDAAG
ncbi:MAG: type II toxin-antitoxin system VapB family antitoxin [Pseudomonadota bacterium]